jgi:outer membrane lipoprotein-sorting protein
MKKIVCLSVMGLAALFSFSFVGAGSGRSGGMDSAELIRQLMMGIENISTLRYDLRVSERVDGQLKSFTSRIKLQRFPRKVYIYIKGVEVLWVQGKNNGDALVNPGAFPYINLNLSPYGSIMTNGQHHTIYEVGFDYFKDVIEYNVSQSGGKFDQCFVYEGEEKFDGRDAYKITILNNSFKMVKYLVKKGETLITIARELRLSEYMIRERNKGIKSYSDIKEGMVIEVPSSYAKMTILYIDQHYFVPLSTRVYDDRGLFESYEYLNLQVNPVIPDVEFSRKFREYHF